MLTWGHDVKITVVQSGGEPGEGAGASHGIGEFHRSDFVSLLRGFQARFVLGVLGLYHSVCHLMTEVARRV